MDSDAFAEALAGDGDCPAAVSDTTLITAMNTAANFDSLGPFRMSLILGTAVRSRTQERF
jgi:hypothetical protein